MNNSHLQNPCLAAEEHQKQSHTLQNCQVLVEWPFHRKINSMLIAVYIMSGQSDSLPVEFRSPEGLSLTLNGHIIVGWHGSPFSGSTMVEWPELCTHRHQY